MFKENEKKFENLFENSPVGISITGIDGSLYVNQTFCKIVGYTEDELEKKTWKEITHPDDIKISEEAYESLLDRKTSVSRFEKRYLKKDGSVAWVDISIHLSKNIQDIPQYFISVIIDISERKQLEMDLINAKRQAEENNNLRSALLNNMSHEIRTPMNAILGFSDLMKDADPDEKDAYADIINKSSMQLLTLIDDVILLSRLQSEKMQLHKSIFKPGNLVADVSLMFGLEKDNKGPVVRHVIPEDFADFVISADYNRIRQVLTNLVSNAIKYTFSGSIEIGFDRKGRQIEFYVKDTGIGIPDHEKGKIFETFYRGEQAISLAIRGTGLGLNIASKLVGLLGGKLEVESEHHVGSKFYFTIPFEEYVRRNDLKQITREYKKQLNKLKVLVVDDEQFNLEFLAILLKDKVKQVDVASNGKEAVEMALKDSYNLVIMDLKMPVMGGIEATKIIKNKFPYLPVIAQTAYALPLEKELAMNAGFDDFITKPIDKETIIKAVCKFC